MSNPNCDNVIKQPTKPRKKNALAHGIYGKDILLPWESRKDFEKLLADLRDDFRPVGRMQNDIVFDLAHLRWQKYRVHKMYIGAAYRDPFVSDLVEARPKSWAEMRSHLRRKSINERTMSELMDEVFLEQTEESAKTLVKAIREGKLANSQIVNGKAFLDVQKDFTTPLIETFDLRPGAEDSLHRTYSPEYLEPIIRLEAMIDARIDKALARLVSLQEYERVRATYSPPLIPADASTPSGNQREGRKWSNNYGGRYFEMNPLCFTGATSGAMADEAAAPPSPAMKSRRRIRHLLKPLWTAYRGRGCVGTGQGPYRPRRPRWSRQRRWRRS